MSSCAFGVNWGDCLIFPHIKSTRVDVEWIRVKCVDVMG